MFLVYLAVLQGVGCVNVEVFGDVAIDLKFPTEKGKLRWYRVWGGGSDDESNQLVFKMKQVRYNVTVAPEVECAYQYPERKQVDSMLSNMMNELTKIFVRATDFINGVDLRRDVINRNDLHRPHSHSPHPRHAKPNGTSRRIGNDTRFRVIDKKQKGFFDVIYTNMTVEYNKFYNITEERVDRAGRDPCQHQGEIKRIWRDLLEHSLQMLQRAARRCVDEYLLDQKMEPRSRNAIRLGQYVEQELAKVRSNQLAMLCDTYQLCYNDLLK